MTAPPRTLLGDLWARQLAFTRRVLGDRGLRVEDLSPAERVAWTKDYILHLEGELRELLDETSWKMHRVSLEPVVRSNVLEEYVDALKFLLGLGQVWGFEPAEVVAEFYRKSEVVEYRYAMEARLRAVESAGALVVAVDVDGVLNDHPASFLEWVKVARPDLETVYGDLFGVDVESVPRLRAALGPRVYAAVRDRYRASGAKRFQGVRPGAKDLLDGLRAAGLQVVLLSKRPYWRFSRIFADTLRWLDDSGLRHDAVLFHREKHRALLDRFPTVLCVVEDEPAVAAEVLAVGVPVVLVDGFENAGAEVPGARRVAGPREALDAVREVLREGAE